jgi:diguanylate cyclase (GGDEF)-like protein
MPLHTPSLAAAAAAMALILAVNVFLASLSPRRDALPAVALGLLLSALSFACAAGEGLLPDWVTEGLIPVSQALAMSCYTWGLLRLRASTAPAHWLKLLVLPALMGALMFLLNTLPTARALSHDAVLIVQCAVLLIWHQQTTPKPTGRAHHILTLGAALGMLVIMLHAGHILQGTTPTSEPLALSRHEGLSLASQWLLAFVPAQALLLMSREHRDLALQNLALLDPLTGIANQLAIVERAAAEVDQARRSGSPLTIVLIEIDQFAALRTRQSRGTVDAALQHTAVYLAQRIRRSDSVGRHGDHAFLMLLPNTPTPGARHMLRALRESRLDAPGPNKGADTLPLSISMGLWCGVPSPRDTAEDLIARAATALQAAQETGTNRMRVAG